MAGLIFSPHGDGQASLGTAFDATPLLVQTDSSTWTQARGIDWAKDNNAKVISLSFGHRTSQAPSDHWWSCALARSAVGAGQANRIVIAAVDNYTAGWDCPTQYPEVMGIGSHDQSGNFVDGVNWWFVDLFAPGVGVATAPNPDQTYWMYNPSDGTSVSTALVSGVAGACHHRYPNGIYNTSTAISFLRTWSQTYPAGISLDAIDAIR